MYTNLKIIVSGLPDPRNSIASASEKVKKKDACREEIFAVMSRFVEYPIYGKQQKQGVPVLP